MIAFADRNTIYSNHLDVASSGSYFRFIFAKRSRAHALCLHDTSLKKTNIKQIFAASNRYRD